MARNLITVDEDVLAAAKALDDSARRSEPERQNKVKANAPAGAVNELFIYGVVGDSWDGLDAKSVIDKVQAMGDVSEIVIRINSGGGYVFDGLAIYNFLANHKARKKVLIDGVAASMASVLAMVGNARIVPENAHIMIHDPWNIAIGNADAMRREADFLDKVKASLVSIYASVTGQARDALAEMMSAETWLLGPEALEKGFATETTAAVTATALTRIALPAALKNVPAPLRAAVAPSGAIDPEASRLKAKENHMEKDAEKAAADQAAIATAAKNAAVEAVNLERARVEGITKAVKALGLKQEIADEHIKSGKPLDQVHAALIDAAANDENKLPSTQNHLRIEFGKDAVDKFREGVASALMAKANIGKDDPANEFRGLTLMDIARESLETRGIKTRGMNRMLLVANAFTHSTSDFPVILENIASKSMMRGYEEAGETFQRWTSVGTLSDFKIASRVDLNAFPNLEVVGEGAEYKNATIGERKETIQLATYGRKFSISRQAIINDDLGAFTRIPRLMGRAAIRTVGNLVYAVLTSNPNMADGVALFHTATHANLAASGAAPTMTSVEAARAAMAKQKDRSSPASAPTTLNLRPKFALTPVAIGGVFRQLVASQWDLTKSTQVPNIVAGLVEVIDDARLDVASATAWHLAADPNVTDTIEVAYLDGVQTPVLETMDGWTIDGVEMKVRIDAGVKALAWEGLYKNPGA
jgi:ATP-dependent protease ClpP protease subunit